MKIKVELENQNHINYLVHIHDDIAKNLIDADDKSKDRILLDIELLLDKMKDD